MKALRILAPLAVLLIAGLLVKRLAFPSTHVCVTYSSPKGRYRLVGYCRDPLPFIASGHNGTLGQPGFVKLIDSAGSVYGESKLSSMLTVGDASDIEWSDGKVSAGVDDHFEFNMPKE